MVLDPDEDGLPAWAQWREKRTQGAGKPTPRQADDDTCDDRCRHARSATADTGPDRLDDLGEREEARAQRSLGPIHVHQVIYTEVTVQLVKDNSILMVSFYKRPHWTNRTRFVSNQPK